LLVAEDQVSPTLSWEAAAAAAVTVLLVAVVLTGVPFVAFELRPPDRFPP
jgi:hypothetical protein